MKYVLFDMDGTLCNSSKGIFRSFRYAFEKLNFDFPQDGDLSDCVGPPLLESFTRIFGGDTFRAEEGVRAYRERYAVLGWQEIELYPYVKECLTSLKNAGYILGVATGKPQVFAEKIVEKCGIDSLFSVVSGSKLDNSFDDKAEIIAVALKTLGANPAQAVMVGDRRQDIVGAKKKGLLSVGIRIGFAKEGELEQAGADHIVPDFYELEKLLLSLR